MRALARAKKLAGFAIEVSSPLDEFGDARRAFADEGFGGGTVDEAVARVDGVIKVQCDVVFAFKGDGDPALRVVGVGFGDGFFCDYQDIAVSGQLDGGAEAGDAGAHDEKINAGQFLH